MEPIIVDTPDGGTAEFPAGTPMETIKGALAKRFPKPQAAPAPTQDRSFLQRAGDFARDQVGWQATRALNAGTALVGTNPIVEPIKHVAGMVAPDWTNRMLGYAYPDTQTMRDAAHAVTGTQPVNLPGTVGKIVDTGVEMAIGGAAFPGGPVRNAVAGFGAGVGSEGAGNIPGIKGTKYEPVARLAGGLVGGATAAAGTEAVTATGRGLRNTFGGNDVDKTAARVVGRGFERDKVAPGEIENRMLALGDDAMPMDAGGPNVRGVLRGATAAPGPARTTTQTLFDERAAGENSRVGASVDRNVSPKGLTQTVDDLIKERNTAPKPLYDKALGADQVWSPRVQQFLDDPLVQPGIKRGLEIQRLEALAKGETFDPKSYGVTGFAADGTPIISGTPNMRLLDAAKKGLDAIVGDYRDKTTGRVVLDERGRAIDSVRKAYVSELDNLNPDYAAARRAYAEPSQMKDAAELGQRLFASNARPDEVKREFSRLPPDAQEAFRIGVAEHLRKVLGSRDASGAAGRVMGGPDMRARLVAVLGEKESAALLRDLTIEKTFTANQRDVAQGSRTTPMMLEANDTAAVSGDVAGAVLRGDPGLAITRALNGFGKRIAQGQNEKVNARIAEMLTNGAPEARRALIDALEQSLLDQRVASPGNTFRAGAALPIVNRAPSGVSAVGPRIQPGDDRRDRPR